MKNLHSSKILKTSLTLVLAALTLCSCGSKSQSYNGFNGTVDLRYDAAPEEYIVYETETGFDGISRDNSVSTNYKAESEEYYAEAPQIAEPTADITNTQTARKIIYSSSYDIETKEFDKSVNALEALCDKYGAYFESSNVYASGGSARRAYYTVRVPVGNYKAFVGEADSVGVVVRSSQDNKDVTESYYDTEARLESAKIREERVLEILKNSAMLDDVLALERELADIRYEIESYTGTLRKYDSLVSFATVTINISEVKEYVTPKPVTVTFGERMSSSFNEGIEEFKEGFQDFLVGLSYNFVPVIIWLVVIVVLVLVVKKVIKKIKRMTDKLDEKNYSSPENDVMDNSENKTDENGEKNDKNA